MTTFRQQVDKILYEEFFKPYSIPQTYKASDSIVYAVTQTIDSLSQSSTKGFCTKTANKIKNKIVATGEAVSPEPK